MVVIARLSLFLLWAMLAGNHCLQWSSGPEQDAVLYACARSTLSLPWNVLEDSGETIDTVRWFYSGRSDEMIAAYTFSMLLPTPPFSNRVNKTTNAGLDIDHVTVPESGNYSVEVVVRDAHGVMTTLRRSVVVHVTDDLQTVDGQLHLNLDPVAQYDNVTDQYHVVIRCGIFTYPTLPPFQVSWVTPSGHALPSSSYQAGSFQLLLPNPVEGGSYVCRVPPAPACLHGNSSGEATVTVDKVEAKMSVLEARQTHLEMENNRLQSNATVTVDKMAVHEARLAHVEMENNRLQNLLAKRVSFHAKLTSDLHFAGDNVVIFRSVTNNDGNGYDTNSGQFRAPFAGTYCFVASSELSDAGLYGSLRMMTDSSQLLDLVSFRGFEINYQNLHQTYGYASGVVHAIVHLNVGQHVWVSAVGALWESATTFSGFLVSADP